MKFLQISPDIHLSQQVDAAWEIQRSGLNVYPLTGEVTERQIAEQCQPHNNYDGILFLTHGGPNGVMLRPSSLGISNGEGELWLPMETVAAYAKAADVQLVVLASCQGRQLAREIYFRSGALVVYSEGDLSLTSAYSLMATFLRQLRDGDLMDALEIADTLGMSHFPNSIGSSPAQLTEFLQQMVAVVTERMDKLEERLGGVERKVDDLVTGSAKSTPRRRITYIIGVLLVLGPLIAGQALVMTHVGFSQAPYLPTIFTSFAIGFVLLLVGQGFIHKL